MNRKIKGLLAGLCTVVAIMATPTGAFAADDDNDGIPNKFEQAGWWNTSNPYTSALLKWTDENYPTACNNDSAAHAFQAVIVYPTGGTSDVETADEKLEFRRMVSRTNSIYAASAQKVINTDANLKSNSTPRWNTFVDSTGKCSPSVMREAIPTSQFPEGSSSSGPVTASQFFNYMASLGYNRSDRKYVYFLQNPKSTDWVGVAQGRGNCDTQTGLSNCSNTGSHLAIRGGIYGYNYWGSSANKDSADTLAHEIGHAIGMTGVNSPDYNPSNPSHSSDCWDIMCYDLLPGGIPGQTYDNGCETSANQESVYGYRMDCKNDGQFNANNPTTGYLATYWNPAKNTFLWGGLSTGASPRVATRRAVGTIPPATEKEIVYDMDAEHEHGESSLIQTLQDLLPLV